MALNVVATAFGPLFSLEEAKQHLRVDGNDDDALIGAYSDAAVAVTLQYCNLSQVPPGETAIAAFKVAALMVLAQYYDQRDGSGGIPPAARLLIDPFRWLRV